MVFGVIFTFTFSRSFSIQICAIFWGGPNGKNHKNKLFLEKFSEFLKLLFFFMAILKDLLSHNNFAYLFWRGVHKNRGDRFHEKNMVFEPLGTQGGSQKKS
jgi:hypothetical protein